MTRSHDITELVSFVEQRDGSMEIVPLLAEDLSGCPAVYTEPDGTQVFVNCTPEEIFIETINNGVLLMTTEFMQYVREQMGYPQ